MFKCVYGGRSLASILSQKKNQIAQTASSVQEFIILTRVQLLCADLINNLQLEPVQLLIEHLGGWPVLNDSMFDDSGWVLEEVLQKILVETGNNYLFFHVVNVDAKQSNAHIITVGTPNITNDIPLLHSF